MKKNIFLAIIIIIIGFISLIFIKNYKLNNKLKKIGQSIELNINDCVVEKETDTHGGFLGDGDYFAKIKCSYIDYQELAKNWKPLPLSEPLNEIVMVKQCGNNGCKNVYEKYEISKIENGYYYFFDRHTESKDKYDDKDLNNRSSWNFSLALLDKDTNIIYFYELDT